MKRINAKTGNGGCAAGKLEIFSPFKIPENKAAEDPSAESARYEAALQKAVSEYKKSIELAGSEKGNDAADILDAQLMMLEDETLDQLIRDGIGQGMCADCAVYSAAESLAEEMQQTDSEYLQARSADIRNVGKKLCCILAGETGGACITDNSVIYASDISPEEIIECSRHHVKALVTAQGSAVSHTSILAATYGIPYIFSPESSDGITSGIDVIIDGDEGILILEPDEETSKIYEEKIKALCEIITDTEIDLPVKLYANIAGPDDAELALKNGAEGIGLFRTEFLFMNRATLPSEDEQFAAYKKAAEIMGDREVIIRTMDIGADKKTECLTLPHEENPALGKRAIRICLDDTELLRTQLRALFRAACFGNIKIMFPMIASEWEIDELQKQMDIAADELKAGGTDYRVPDFGIMVETPAAAVCSGRLAERVSFFSIGSNDLTQYTLAADRMNSGIEKYFNSMHEAVLTLITQTAKNAHDHDIMAGICGEMCSDPKNIPAVLKTGVDELSMSPGRIPAVRKAIIDYLSKQTDIPR